MKLTDVAYIHPIDIVKSCYSRKCSNEASLEHIRLLNAVCVLSLLLLHAGLIRVILLLVQIIRPLARICNIHAQRQTISTYQCALTKQLTTHTIINLRPRWSRSLLLPYSKLASLLIYGQAETPSLSPESTEPGSHESHQKARGW